MPGSLTIIIDNGGIVGHAYLTLTFPDGSTITRGYHPVATYNSSAHSPIATQSMTTSAKPITTSYSVNAIYRPIEDRPARPL
jgi:hypothetical protein